MNTVMTEGVVAITDALIDTAQFSPFALASKIVKEDDPRLDELVAILEAAVIKLRRCPCVCCERDLIPPEHAILELLPVGDDQVRLHMCCEECLND